MTVVLCFPSSADCCGCHTHTHTYRSFWSISFRGYTRPTLASPMAPQTSKTNSSGKAKSPRVSSKASANSSGFFLSFPSSTMVAAEETERGQRTLSEHEAADNTNRLWQRRHTRTQLAVSDAHVALQQVVHLLDGLFLERRRLQWTENQTNRVS